MFLSPRLVEVIRSTATTLKSILAGAPPLHPGSLFLCSCKEKVTKKKARPIARRPTGGTLCSSPHPGARPTRRRHKTPLGLDHGLATPPPAEAPVLGSLYGAQQQTQQQPRPNTAPTLTLPATRGREQEGESYTLCHCEQSEAISTLPRLLRRYAPRNDRQNVKDRGGYTPGSPMARP